MTEARYFDAAFSIFHHFDNPGTYPNMSGPHFVVTTHSGNQSQCQLFWNRGGPTIALEKSNKTWVKSRFEDDASCDLKSRAPGASDPTLSVCLFTILVSLGKAQSKRANNPSYPLGPNQSVTTQSSFATQFYT